METGLQLTVLLTDVLQAANSPGKEKNIKQRFRSADVSVKAAALKMTS